MSKPHPHWTLRARIAHERLNDEDDEEDMNDSENEDDGFGTAQLREGETRDDDAHARRNAEQLRMADEVLDRDVDTEPNAEENQ